MIQAFLKANLVMTFKWTVKTDQTGISPNRLVCHALARTIHDGSDMDNKYSHLDGTTNARFDKDNP